MLKPTAKMYKSIDVHAGSLHHVVRKVPFIVGYPSERDSCCKRRSAAFIRV